MQMEGVDVLAKLYALKDHLNELAPNDAAFVSEIVTLNESGHMLNRHQILQIVDMAIPGEPPKQPDVHTIGLVNVVFVAPDEKIWRYIPLEQLFALLSMKALHFSPLSVMEDIAEGQLPGRAWEETKKQLPQEILEGRGSMDADAMMAIMVNQRRTDACINCWYMDGSLLDLLGVLPGVALRVVAYKYRLTKRDAVGDCVNGVLCAVSVLGASGAEVFQPIGLHLGPLNQSSVFVADLTGQFNAEVFAARCPHRGNKKVLFRCPFEPCCLHALIGFCVETAGSIEAEFVIFGAVSGGNCAGHLIVSFRV
jgi:hypothetical protein